MRDKVETSSNTHFIENSHSLQIRGGNLEEPIRNVGYQPNKNNRELHQCNSGHCYVDSFDNVAMKTRER